MVDLNMPITDEQAKALGSVAEMGTEGIKATSRAGSYVASIVAGVPQDLIGVAGGDWLHHKRQRNLATLAANTAAHLERIATDRLTQPSPSVVVPLLTGAAEESREELQTLWAALLANAMVDGGKKVRVDFFNVVRKLEPLDAILLEAVSKPDGWRPNPHVGTYEGNADSLNRLRSHVAARGLSENDFQISVEALERLGCFARRHHDASPPDLSAFGRGLVAACQ